MAQIRIENLRKEFGTFTAVESSSFTIENGEFFMLLGPSGCGKTTTLRMIAGLELPTSGYIYIDGEEVGMKPASKRDIAFVFQLYALYPHMNVGKNIAYPLLSQGMSRKEAKRKVKEVAQTLGIENILDRNVGGLSSGDRQRVALGRAIVREPKVFLMDEPLGALDAEFREHMAEELRALHDRIGATTIYVTHDQLEAMQMGDKIVVMDQGVIQQSGKPQDIYDWPVNKFVADFIGSPAMNFLDFEGVIDSGMNCIELNGHKISVPAFREGAKGKLSLGVRPEHIHFSDHSSYRGEVVAVEYLGTTQIVTMNTHNGSIKVRVSSNIKVNENELIGLEFNASTLTVFNGESGQAILSDTNAGIIKHG